MVEPEIRCSYCGSILSGSNKFCPNCGTPQVSQASEQPAVRFCPNCGSQVPAASSFCARCGTNLQTPWVPQYQPMPQPGPYPQRRGRGALFAVVAVILVASLVLTVIIASGLISTSTGNNKAGDGAFDWTYGSKRYSVDISIPYAEYQDYRNDPTQRYATTIEEAVTMCDIYVTPDEKVVQELAQALENMSAGFSDIKTANFVLSFVQNIEYVEDSTSVSEDEYWRFPVETLYDEMGDCEDKAFLYASVMEAMGFDAVILLFDGHAAGGIDVNNATGTFYEYDGVDYFYCETTAVGWSVGEIPDEYGSAYIAQVS